MSWANDFSMNNNNKDKIFISSEAKTRYTFSRIKRKARTDRRTKQDKYLKHSLMDLIYL